MSVNMTATSRRSSRSSITRDPIAAVTPFPQLPSPNDRPATPQLLDRLELLERLPAARAVADRTARRRAEDVLELRLRRPAVRAAVHDRLQLDESWSRRRESRRAQLLAAGGRDLVRPPGVVVHHLDVRLAA